MPYAIARSSIDVRKIYHNGTLVAGADTVFSMARTGERVTGRKGLIRAGLQAGSVYFLSANKCSSKYFEASDIYFKDKFSGVISKSTWTGVNPFQCISPPAPLNTSLTEVNNIALKKLYKKIRSESSHFNGQSFVGELRDTIRMLKHPFSGIRNKVYEHLNTLSKRKRAMQGYPKGVRERAWRQAVADTWLETSFCLKTLINDSKEIAESIARSLEDPVRRTRLRTGAELLDKSVIVVPDHRDYGISFRYTSVTETKRYVSYTCGMEAVVEAASGSLERFRQILGFTPENFVPALYEIMPWSWLIDYFSNLGDIIEAGATDTSAVKWIVRSNLTKTTRVAVASINPQFTIDMWKASSTPVHKILVGDVYSVVKDQAVLFERSLPASLGVPSLTLESPLGSPGKILNMLAVMTQFSGRHFDPSWSKRFRQSW